MTTKALYPTIEPSLELDFANTKALDPRISFTRASTGTYVGADGLIKTAGNGVARFDHNPVTGESLGLLVEEARTNLALYSEQFDNAYWQGAIFTRTPNAAVAPDGTITADKLTPNNGVTSNNFTISRVFSGLTGSTTGSFYVKSAGHRYARISAYVLDLLSTQNGQYSAYVGNGWHRIYHEFTTSSFDFGLNITALVPGQGYTGNGVDGIYIWGAQLEAGAFPTSYIPTVASTVTRAADVASITGANFSSWYNQSAGVFFAKYSRTPGGRVGIVTGLPNEYSWTAIADERGSRGFTTRFNGTEIFDNPSIPAGATIKQIGAYSFALSQSSLCVNGRTVLNSSHAQTNPTGITIGGGSNINYLCLNAPISQIYYWPARFSDATLQTLTQ